MEAWFRKNDLSDTCAIETDGAYCFRLGSNVLRVEAIDGEIIVRGDTNLVLTLEASNALRVTFPNA